MGNEDSRDAGVRACCRRQGGAFSARQARACGLPRTTVSYRVRSGRYRSHGSGVYSDAAVPVTDRTRRFIALLAVGRDAVLARHTAAAVWELSAAPSSPSVHVLVGCTCPHTREGVVVHRTVTLRRRHVTESLGYPVTTPERTVCDLAADVGPVRLRRIVAEVVRRELASPGSIADTMEDMGPFAGKVAMRELLEVLSPTQVATRSALESEFLHVTTTAGIPPSAMNHPVLDADGRTRYIDAVYLPQRIPVELDSRLAHGTLLDWQDDQRRENAVALVGWRSFLRFSWDDVFNRPQLVVRTLRRALATSVSATPASGRTS